MKRNKGFTLIELLVVSTIIVVLSAIGLVSFTNAGKGARDSKRKADLETVRQAMVLYRSDSPTGGYPNGSDYDAIIAQLLAGSYIGNPTPQDPKNPDQTYERGVSGSNPCICAEMEKIGAGDTNGCTLTGSGSQTYCLPPI